MFSRTGSRVSVVVGTVSLMLLLWAGQAQAQLRGRVQQRQVPGQQTNTAQSGTVGAALLQQQNAVQTACQNLNALQNSLPGTGSSSATGSSTTGSPSATDLQTLLQQFQTTLQQLQSDLQTAVQLTTALLTALQQQQTVSPTLGTALTLTALQQQQSGLQTALQQTNSLLTALQQQTGQQTVTQLKTLNQQRTALLRQLRTLQTRSRR
jgi:hypothetical protein